MIEPLSGPASHSFISMRLRLHYVDWGNPDAAPLVLVHGGQDHCRNWDWVAQDLRRDYHVIAPDLRGHGDSEHSASGDYSMARYTSEIKRLYEVLEKRLGEAPYLGGQDYSIADIATFPWTRNHDAQGVKWEDNPHLARWFNAISERPAVKAALAKIAVIKSNRETASNDDKDRFFNRGRYARA